MSSTHATDDKPSAAENGQPRDPRKFYRFALYGRSGSGKTCVLARMAMGALGHPHGLTCTRLPVTVPKPSGDPKSFGDREKEAVELHRGQEWIGQAINRLSAGDLPAGNLPEDQLPPTVDFEINDRRRGATFVRMIDYSGELIAGIHEHDPESMANALKARLQGLDGLIVLADASSGGTRGENLDDDHRELREALKSLADDPKFERAAVVVAFTKWDRESEIDPDDPEAEYARLDDFLRDHRSHSHKALVDSIRVAARVGESNAGAGRIAFPTSAFGRSVVRDGFDHPAQGRDEEKPRPLGVLEPVLALADLRDAIDAEKVEAELASVPWWTPWPSNKLRKLRSRAAGLLPRMPEKSEKAKRIRKARGTAFRRFWGVATALAAIVAAGIYFGGGWEVNSRRFDRLVAGIDGSLTSEDQLKDARGRLQRYEPGGWARRLPFAPAFEKVGEVRMRIDDALDDILWRGVETAAELAEKAAKAEEYLALLPLGRHVEEAKDVVKRYADLLVEREAESRLNAWDKRIQEADADQAKLLDILSEVKSWPYEGRDDSKLARRDALAKRCLDQVSARNWSDILGILDSTKDVKGAAEKWGRLAGADEHWKDHVPDLIARIRKITEGDVADSLKKERFDDAARSLAEARDGLAFLEKPARDHAPDLVETVMAAIRDAGPQSALGVRVSRAKDHAKYEAFREAPSIDLAGAYLADVPDGAMRKQVQAYFDYLNAQKNATKVGIAAFILWDKDYQDGRTGQILTVWMDDQRVLDPVKNLTSSSGNMSPEVGRFDKSVPAGEFLSTGVRFGVRIDEEGILFGFIRLKRAPGVELGGHAVSTWSCVRRLRGGGSACPPACCITPSACVATNTRGRIIAAAT